MYPLLRFIWQVAKHRNDPPLGFYDTHVSSHYCMPWDIDPWLELNNGRTLTLYDLARIPLGIRTGLSKVLKRRGWGLTVAGTAVRYRRRVRAMEKVTMKSRCVGFDRRFFYIEQSMWKANGECASHAVLRKAVTSKQGIVPPSDVIAEFGSVETSPELPEWITSWLAAEDKRPWPPMQS